MKKGLQGRIGTVLLNPENNRVLLFVSCNRSFYFLPKSAGISPHFSVSHLMMALA